MGHQPVINCYYQARETGLFASQKQVQSGRMEAPASTLKKVSVFSATLQTISVFSATIKVR